MRGSMPTDRSSARLLFLLTLASAAGCGAEAYQSRIDGNSIPLFAYRHELDSSLAPSAWRRGEVSLRLPNNFKEVPAPKKKPGSPGAGRDPRLPPGFDIDLPGLLGGFRGTMKAEASGGKTVEVPVHAFVLSNRFLLSSREPGAKPDAYDATLLNTLGAGLRKGNVSKTTLKSFVPTESLSPEQRGFASAPRFERTSLDATADDVPMRYELYIHREAKLQVAVIFVVPKDPARDEQLRKRIDLSLQTLRVEIAGGTGTAAPAAAPQGSSTGPGF